ncbi:MAG: endonuclease/exonuclease/phosphatase family protein [Burkholderiales bacterium]|nr:endonuclease/exonuclease/phosphatase family protein [Burkholderiales bacterium]
MIVITWNIQWGRGVDGRVDLARIVDTARAMGDFDVLCLQEVAHNYPGLETPALGNQWEQLAALLPGFHATEGVAVDRFTEGIGRQRFGNMILSRAAPLQVLRHALPWPADASHPSMPRMAIEAVLPAGSGAVRIVTTHLEYYSARQRAAQVEALRRLQAEAAGHAGLPARENRRGGPFEVRPRPSRGVLCGDFNCSNADPMLARLQEPEGDAPGWCDAWPIANPGQPHAMTLGLYDRKQWPDGAQCFDFFFVSQDLAGRVRRVKVDAVTQASDHQPVLLELDA